MGGKGAGEAEGWATSIPYARPTRYKDATTDHLGNRRLHQHQAHNENPAEQANTEEEKGNQYCLCSSFIFSHKHSGSLSERRPGVLYHLLSLNPALQRSVNQPLRPQPMPPSERFHPAPQGLPTLILRAEPHGSQHFWFSYHDDFFLCPVFLLKVDLISGYVNNSRYSNS